MSDTHSTVTPSPRSASENIMYEIVATVAEAKGCDPTTLRPIAEVMNTEAVETVLSNPEVTISLGFEYEGGLVRVSEAGVEYEVTDE
ncbi:HalOD1 output domain-containing protein [Halogeometricum luteum]|uniref:Halobacterial output domain-containing protein n=1 Tax=Halogeometricum luteum TaxID=2950537 RepID=A0ABU2G7J4_9EURY|nr:HalOD1 output domain-containing protein [Halogeometricum sp. S3BR5-2]MDS0296269.1 hypothetical protein [Halogeometricum sp. S3BR5-2]